MNMLSTMVPAVFIHLNACHRGVHDLNLRSSLVVLRRCRGGIVPLFRAFQAFERVRARGRQFPLQLSHRPLLLVSQFLQTVLQ